MNDSKASNDYEVYSAMVRHEMVPFIPEDAKAILDVGCSVGNFGVLLKRESAREVWGVEIDPRAAAVASDGLDKVICGTFGRNAELAEKKFDCIVFNDVLEHMVDPYGALEYARDLLKSDGVVVASIPNVRYFGNIWPLVVHGLWEYQDTGILDRTHLRFFTKKSILSMFDGAGFEIEIIQGINPLEICDRYFTRKYQVLKALTFNRLEDMRWLQFAVVAKLKNNSE